MEEIKDKQEEAKDTTEESYKNTDEPVDLIEMVRAKHKNESDQKAERISDIFTAQLILCILIVLGFVILNIIDKSSTEWFIDEFKKMTMNEPEQIIKDAVNYVKNILK